MKPSEESARRLADALLRDVAYAAAADLCVVLIVAPTSEVAGPRARAFMRSNMVDEAAVRLLRGYVAARDAL